MLGSERLFVTFSEPLLEEMMWKYPGATWTTHQGTLYESGAIHFAGAIGTFKDALYAITDLTRLGWLVTRTEWVGADLNVARVSVTRPRRA